MERRGDQQGAALVLVIGVIATLALLASALVFLTGNAASNTARDRNRAKAFNMAEAAVDLALFKVGTEAGSVPGVTTGWPLTAATQASLTTDEKNAFLGRFPESEFPGAKVSIDFFDSVLNGVRGPAYDVTPDGRIYIEAQALVGGQKARIQIEAQRILYDNKFPRGIAVATDGSISGNGSNNPADAAISATPPLGNLGEQSALTLMASGTIASSTGSGTPYIYNTNYFPSGNVQQPPDTSSNVVDSVLDPEVLQQFIKIAQAQGKWYSDISSEQLKGAKLIPTGNNVANFEGIVVVETTNSLTFNGNGTYNGTGVAPYPKPPGVLMVIGPRTMYPDDQTQVGVSQGIEIKGVGLYFGVMYTDGRVWGAGTVDIAGMVLAKGSVELTGTRKIEYNDNVLANLTKSMQVSAQIVPNTWRQIRPTPGPMP